MSAKGTTEGTENTEGMKITSDADLASDPWIAFGVTFEIEDFLQLIRVCAAAGLSVEGEGTGASGYEACARESQLDAILERVRLDPDLRGREIKLYDNPRNELDGTRYDRVIEHFCGPDPNRPSLSGIEISETGLRGIVRDT